jgi:type III secretion protein V
MLDSPHILTHHLAFVLKKYASDFLGLQETKYLLEQMEPRFGEIVREVQRVLPIHKLTEVLQRLVQEEISIRNLRVVLQALIDWGQKEKDTVLLVEYVRSSLRRYISYKYAGNRNMLPVYLLDPEIEEMIRKAIRQTSGGAFLALDPASAKAFITAVKKAVGNLDLLAQKPVLLTTMDVRRYIKKLLESELRGLPVLSYQELTEEINIQPLEKITMG